MNIEEIRAKYPQYKDIPDKQLVTSLHDKFYADMPLLEFANKIGFKGSFNQNDLKKDETDQLFRSSIQQATSGMPGFMAGIGKAFADVGRGARQIAGSEGIQEEIDQARQTDQPLMQSGAGIAGNILGNTALFAPTAMIPGVNTYTGAALTGATLGAVAPVATGESRAMNAIQGGAAGTLGQGVGRGIGRLIRPVQTALSPQQAQAAQTAGRYGIPLRLSQQTGSKPMAIAESVMESMPLTSQSAAAAKGAQLSAFTRAALAKAGVRAEAATPQVLQAQKEALGSTFENIASQSSIDFNKPGIINRLGGIVQNAARRLEPGKAKLVADTVDDILSQVDDTGRLAGTNYQGWRAELRKLGKGTDYNATVYQQIKKTLDEAFKSQIGGKQAAEWTRASRQYANLKTILDAMGAAGAGTKAGTIPPAALEQALTKAIGREGKALGRGDLNKLVGVGRQFVSESIPDSGTAQRQFMMRLLTGQAGGILPGAAAGYYAGGTPESAVAGAALGSGGALVAPRIVQALMQSKAGQAYLTRGLARLSPDQIRLLTNALRTGAIAASPAMAPQ